MKWNDQFDLFPQIWFSLNNRLIKSAINLRFCQIEAITVIDMKIERFCQQLLLDFASTLFHHCFIFIPVYSTN